MSFIGRECQENCGGNPKFKEKASVNYFILFTTRSGEPQMRSITFYSKDKQHIGHVNYTIDFAEWLLDKGLYRIEGVSASETIVLEEDDEEESYKIEVVLLTNTARKKLLTFFQSAIIQESLTRSWKLELLHDINDFLENQECLYMDYFE